MVVLAVLKLCSRLELLPRARWNPPPATASSHPSTLSEARHPRPATKGRGGAPIAKFGRHLHARLLQPSSGQAPPPSRQLPHHRHAALRAFSRAPLAPSPADLPCDHGAWRSHGVDAVWAAAAWITAMRLEGTLLIFLQRRQDAVA